MLALLLLAVLVLNVDPLQGISHHHGGIDFIGVGYNLLNGNPDGGDNIQGGIDPGLLVLRKIFQLSPGDIPREVLFEERYSCAEIKSTHVFYGAKSYQDKLSTGIDSSGTGNAKLVGFSFSLSSRFAHASSETNHRRNVFQDDEHICNLGRVRFTEELADTDGYSVTRNFASAVCKLPAIYDTNAYMKFLDEWGTHVTMEVEMGNRTIKRYQASLTQFIQHVQKSGAFGFAVGGSYMGFGGSLGVDFNKFKESDKYEMKFGQYEYTLISGKTGQPEPIHLKVKTLVTAMDPVYWRTPEVLSVCPIAKTQLNGRSSNMLRALEAYAKYKLAPDVTDPPLKIPITWPSGSYGLIKSSSGCPAGRVKWNEGWRYQDTADMFSKNSWSNPIHISGTFNKKSGFKIHFCMKGTERISDYDVDWPPGDYCILKYGNCPINFQSGYIYWDDEDMKNHNRLYGSLPDGHFDKNTLINYCCRQDSLPTTEILLPTNTPFFLLKYTRECQHVHGMMVREETVRWDDEDAFNRDRSGGAHPYDDGGSHNHRLHFCYYHKPSSNLVG